MAGKVYSCPLHLTGFSKVVVIALFISPDMKKKTIGTKVIALKKTLTRDTTFSLLTLENPFRGNMRICSSDISMTTYI